MKESEFLYVLQSDIMYDWDDDGKSLDVCFNRETKEVENVCLHCGIWYTRDGIREYKPNVLSAYDAINKEIFTKEEVVNACFEKMDFDKHIANALTIAMSSKMNDLSIPCSVVGGRKWKGKGILIRTFLVSPYKPFLQPTCKSVVVDEHGDEHIVTSAYVTFEESIRNDFLLRAKEIAAQDLHRLSRQFAYKASYSSCDTDTFNNYFVGCLLRAMKSLRKKGETK